MIGSDEYHSFLDVLAHAMGVSPSYQEVPKDFVSPYLEQKVKATYKCDGDSGRIRSGRLNIEMGYADGKVSFYLVDNDSVSYKLRSGLDTYLEEVSEARLVSPSFDQLVGIVEESISGLGVENLDLQFVPYYGKDYEVAVRWPAKTDVPERIACGRVGVQWLATGPVFALLDPWDNGEPQGMGIPLYEGANVIGVVLGKEVTKEQFGFHSKMTIKAFQHSPHPLYGLHEFVVLFENGFIMSESGDLVVTGVKGELKDDGTGVKMSLFAELVKVEEDHENWKGSMAPMFPSISTIKSKTSPDPGKDPVPFKGTLDVTHFVVHENALEGAKLFSSKYQATAAPATIDAEFENLLNMYIEDIKAKYAEFVKEATVVNLPASSVESIYAMMESAGVSQGDMDAPMYYACLSSMTYGQIRNLFLMAYPEARGALAAMKSSLFAKLYGGIDWGVEPKSGESAKGRLLDVEGCGEQEKEDGDENPPG